jgi:hypothetical protein
MKERERGEGKALSRIIYTPLYQSGTTLSMLWGYTVEG